MNRFTLWIRRLVPVCVVLAAIAGCENNDDVITEDDGGGSVGFVITPSAVNLGFDESNASFSVQGGDAPMAWTVSDASLGGVTSTDGRVVNYVRSGASEGVNEITVTDAIGRTARAVVVQDDQGDSGTLRVSPPEAILHSLDDVVTLTATGGIPPYSWSLIDSSIGALSNTGQSAVNYRRTTDAEGTNVVELRDSQGTLATAIMTHRVIVP